MASKKGTPNNQTPIPTSIPVVTQTNSNTSKNRNSRSKTKAVAPVKNTQTQNTSNTQIEKAMKAADSAAVPMTLANAVELVTPVPVATPVDTNTVEIAQFKELVETSEQIREMLGALVQNIEPALKFSSWRPAPTKANPTDTCWDLVATSVTHTDKYVEYGTSLRTEIPEGLWGDVRARSSIRNYDLVMCNSTAVIDNPYRGEWKVCFKIVRHVRPGIKGWWDRLRNLFTAPKLYNVGDKIAQVYFPQQGADVIWTRVNTVSMDTERGDGGFGSSDALKSTLGTSNNGTGTSTKASTPTT